MSVASRPSTVDGPNEDWVSTSPSLTVVLDGATARGQTGCRHGITWYAERLGAALSASASDPATALTDALGTGIEQVAALHPECDLAHEGTPSASVAIVRFGPVLEYLVLGDVVVVMDTPDGTSVVSDERVDGVAVDERRAADRYPIGSPEKAAALVRMKRVEVAMRNRDGGYWIAATDPRAARHAVTGRVDPAQVRRLAVLTDGAARVVRPFGDLTWERLLDLLDAAGPDAALRRVRAIEEGDPHGDRWPRNKRSDDATVAYVSLQPGRGGRVGAQPVPEQP